MQLVGYLVTGADTHAEPDLVIAKLLCAVTPEEPVPRTSLLLAGDREEGDTMLEALIGHWNALGGTSPEGLRDGFLRRPGQLRETDDAWNLTVERRGIDVLIGRLPWGLSAVRTPWMTRPILVDWA